MNRPVEQRNIVEDALAYMSEPPNSEERRLAARRLNDNIVAAKSAGLSQTEVNKAFSEAHRLTQGIKKIKNNRH